LTHCDGTHTLMSEERDEALRDALAKVLMPNEDEAI
jgi:hypothetical protein